MDLSPGFTGWGFDAFTSATPEKSFGYAYDLVLQCEIQYKTQSLSH